MLKTLYDLPVNPKLIGDYSFSESKLQSEVFFKWYLGRVLEQGNSRDLRGIPFAVIETHLDTLILSHRTRRFGERYFREIRDRHF